MTNLKDPRYNKDQISGTTLTKLTELMALLRSPRGCPWDKVQTRESIIPFVLEEAYEVVGAIESGDDARVKEELGDLLLQVVFLSELAREQAIFDIDDVIQGSLDKMIRRHPHVFTDAIAKTPEDVLHNWDEIKKTEGKEKSGYLSGICSALPSLLQAHKVSKKAAKTGFDWKDTGGVFDKIDEELGELKEALADDDSAHIEEELGDLLFTVVNLARKVKVNPEEALRKTTRKFIRRFHYIEKTLLEKSSSLEEATIEEMEALWAEAKKVEGKPELKSKKQAKPSG
jgi:MazG family protein